MAGKGWNDLGQDLNRIIEDAIHMGDFRRLNDNIRGAFGQFFPGMDAGYEPLSKDNWDFDLSGSGKEKKDFSEPEDVAFERAKPVNRASGKRQTDLFAGRKGRKVPAVVLIVAGILLAILNGPSMLLVLVFGILNIDVATAVFLVMTGAFTAAGIVMIGKGISRNRLSNKFDQYLRLLDGKTYIDISMLAQYSHSSRDDVIKTVKKMLKKRWFRQGHLDPQESCLMISDEAYSQYLETVRNVKQQQEEETLRKKEMESRRGYSAEVEAVLAEGKEYVRRIRKSNDEIPGEEISAKIYRMELLVARIFRQLEAHPENIGDLRKLMEYYLPMTIKLLDAYEELDRQPVYGENINASKKEIEDALDTLNTAFEKLLDNLFREKSWDVSADISVLQAMLAQEGLTEDDFNIKQGK